jgi:hypothetical protein
MLKWLRPNCPRSGREEQSFYPDIERNLSVLNRSKPRSSLCQPYVSITNRHRYVLFICCFMKILCEAVSEVAVLLRTCSIKLNQVPESSY